MGCTWSSCAWKRVRREGAGRIVQGRGEDALTRSAFLPVCFFCELSSCIWAEPVSQSYLLSPTLDFS